MEAELTGIVNAGINFEVGSSMSELRDCMLAWIVHKIQLLQGTPPRHHALLHRLTLRMFVAGSDRNVIRHVLCQLLPNGNWFSDEIDVWVPDLAAISDQQTYKIEVLWHHPN